MDGTWPLTARTGELGLLESALEADDRHGAVLCGPAGVGKSRLALEAAMSARRAGWCTLRVTATRSMAGIPFGAMAHLLPTGDVPAAVTADLMARLRDEVRRHGTRVVLVVDDAHLLDEPSCGAVHMLAASGTAFVLVTARSGEPVPDAVAALWKDGLAVRIDVRPLSRRGSDEVLAAGLGGRVDRMTRNRLWHATRGNVLFLRELVLAGLDSGHLRCRDGLWSWQGEITVGERLTELIETRLTGLCPGERAVLEVLALGEPLGPAFLPASSELVAALEERGLVAVTQDWRRTQVRLAHPLYGESLRNRMGLLRRQSVLAALADRLAATGARRRGDLLKVATWRLDGGLSLDTATLVAAAREARSVFDHRTAERFARIAVVQGGCADAHVLLADALYWQGRHQEASAVLDRTPADETRTPASLAWQAVVASSNLFWGHGDAPAAERTLEAARHALGPGAEHDELAAHQAGLAIFNGRPGEALAVAEAVLTAPAATDLTRARALAAMIPALAVTGRTDRAIELADLGIHLADAVAEDEPWTLSHFELGKATACWLSGRLARMHELTQRRHAMTTGLCADDTRGMWATLLGQALLAIGRVAAARDQFGEAAHLLRDHDGGGFLSWCLAGGCIAGCLLGEVDEARTLLRQAYAAQHPAARIHEGEVLRADAWLAATVGETSRARQMATAAADLAASRGQLAVEAVARHDAARLGATGHTTRLAHLASRTDGPLGALFAEHAAALAACDGNRLDRVAERFADIGAMLYAAEAAASAGPAHERAGDVSARVSATNRALALARRCEGASTPVLRLLDAPLSDALTIRERQVAELASAGLTNREISERLVLSVRTVGNHLNHIYGKLGVTRDDLPGLVNLLRPRHERDRGASRQPGS